MAYKILKLTGLLLFVLTSSLLKAQIIVTADSTTIGTYNVIEFTIAHPKTYPNNWEDVTVNAVFTGPQTINLSGFYFNTNTWKVRFAPPKAGAWSYSITFTTPTNTYTATGKFTCVPSNTKGFLKRHPNDPYRLIYADGTLFNGVGLEDCALDVNNDNTPLDDFGFDGGFLAPGYVGNFTGLNTYMNAYGANGAGFNLYRWTTNNCSFGLYNTITTSGNTYLAREGMQGDTLIRALRKNKLRVWMTYFGPPVFNTITGSTPLEEAAVKRYVNYIVARYGAYVDIWELFNESSATDYYVNTITEYIRSIDPYHRLISISDERPKLLTVDIISPHWYEKESELESDARAYTRITSLKNYNKPIIFGEQGNAVQNWDPLSATRMRLRSWTSFFAEGMLIFWNTSYAKNFNFNPLSANIYLGPEERGYIRALQDYSAHADSAVVPMGIYPLNSSDVRGYGLRSPKLMMGYFHHYSTHASNVNTSFLIRLRQSGTIYWINPADNTVLGSSKLTYGLQTISSPPFNIDIAMRIDLDPNFPVFDEAEKLDLIVYPNPAASSIYIYGNFNQPAAITLYDMKGRKIFSKNNIVNDQRIELQGVAKGIYVYKVTTGNRQATGKVVINQD